MYATKTPSYRIDQKDLKCKNGCGFYGNAQWQGFCSKCHREQIHRQRRAEKPDLSTSGVVRESQVLEREVRAQTSPIAGFTKFEEKKLRQSDSQKKTKLLNVFRKSSNAKDVGPDRHIRERSQWEPVITSKSLEQIKREFFKTFPKLNPVIEKDVRKYIQIMFANVHKQIDQGKTIDELSEITQNLYQMFAKRMDENQNYMDVTSETKELLLDFLEKYAMTHLHTYVFSMYGNNDETKDASLHSKIRRLCWISPAHLDCHIDHTNVVARDLLYTAITELVAMDSVPSPGEKLAHIVACCRSVVGVISATGSGPASADELLPALIFTVLKANPPRLISNVNYITRFCNAARLMTGEGGYYFTNLCCAVSFVDNLTPESLNMTKKDFDLYMDLPLNVGGGSWVAALSLCEGLHDLNEQLKTLKELDKLTTSFEQRVQDLSMESNTFKKEVLKKVSDILARTPLEFTRRKVQENIKEEVEFVNVVEDTPGVVVSDVNSEPSTAISADDIFGSCSDDKTTALLEGFSSMNVYETIHYDTGNKHLIPPDSLANISMALDNPPMPTLRTIGSGDFLSPSPIFGLDSFDTQSLDELATPDEYGVEQFTHGLTNVNYDIDLSDLSAENSAAEDIPSMVDSTRPKSQDPFSPDGLPQSSTVYNWQSIQPEALKPETSTPRKPLIPIQGNDESVSILDAADSPTTDCLLPSPLKPNTLQNN